MGVLDNRGNLSGGRAVVVGGAGGIGRAVTLALAEAEVDVAFCDIDAEAVTETLSQVRALGRRAVGEVAPIDQICTLGH